MCGNKHTFSRLDFDERRLDLELIKDWQIRERPYWGIETGPCGTNIPWKHNNQIPPNLKLANVIIKETKKQIQYLSDEEQYNKLEYWETSGDVQKTLSADCEGQACYAWMKMQYAGFDPALTFMIGMKGHIGNVIYIPSDTNSGFTPYYADNGYITSKFKPLNSIFPLRRNGKTKIPLFCYNLNSMFSYKRVG